MKVNPILDVRREPDEPELPTTELAPPALDAKGHAEPDQARPDEVSDVHGVPRDRISHWPPDESRIGKHASAGLSLFWKTSKVKSSKA